MSEFYQGEYQEEEAPASPKMETKPELEPTQEILKIESERISIPNHPWMPTYAGFEFRVTDPDSEPLVPEKERNLSQELAKIAEDTVIAAEVAGAYAEADDPKNPDWYNKPWFNLNANSQIGDEKFSSFTWQVYLRPRTLGQMRVRSKSEYSERSDEWSNPYWSVPMPVDYPLNPDDRRPYAPEVQKKITDTLDQHFKEKTSKIKEAVEQTKLFADSNGTNTLEQNFPFRIDKGNYPVWQAGDYLLVTQDNPLVDRKDGVHLVLIYRGEQQGEEERYSYHWRDPRRIAEMAIIAAAASKIITKNGYGGFKFDRSYIHLNANWSLDYALPEEERLRITQQEGADMDFGSVGPGKWPGPPESQTGSGPNAHPHIQVIKKNEPGETHDLDIAPSPKAHAARIKDRQTDQEIEALKELFERELTPAIKQLQGKTIAELKKYFIK